VRTYWSARAVAEAGTANPFVGTFANAVDELDALLRDAVGLRMIADVPLGVFLSGGIDSSTVAALMQAQSSRPIKTFSIGFHEEAYNEARHAAAVARHLGTDHTELYVTAEEALAVIPRLPRMYDEPFADASQIPTFLVSQLARRHVTVALSGDGGDELFAGYNRYFWGRGIWNRIGWMPATMRRALAGSLTALSPEMWERIFGALGAVLPQVMKQRTPGDQLHKLAGVLAVQSADEMYWRLTSAWNDPGALVLGAEEHPSAFTDAERVARLPDFTLRMMQLDLITYLPDDLLVKVDRASMAVSLEAREPLLDHRLAEFAWRLPLEMKMQGTLGKRVLREVLYRYVPRELIERPKMGFGIPIHSWLRGPLREWAEELLSESRLRREGIFVPQIVRHAWCEHLSGRRNWQYRLWGVLMFQAWMDQTGAS
jgi:asparagine synthase (glutamine-hydrolysing)